MRRRLFIIVTLACGFLSSLAAENVKATALRIHYIHPSKGDDQHDGHSPKSAWKTFKPLNSLTLGSNDLVIVEPGTHESSLVPKAKASAENPAIIRFMPGTHEFSPAAATRRPWFISNSCDAPTVPKPCAILVENCHGLRLEGAASKSEVRPLLLMGGRMIHFINSHSENITYTRLNFDLKRPTVSEFRVIDSAPGRSDIQIAEGSTYAFKENKFTWTGDLGSGAVMTQQAIPSEGRCWRIGFNWNPFEMATSIHDLGNGKFRLNFKDNYQLPSGHQFQFRHIFRDSAGGFNDRSKNISIHHCDFYALANMGIISQFTENITYRHVNVIPPPNTIRTCPAWADAFHFSGCRGTITVENCKFSGLQDDAINVHGTHLRIFGKPADNQLLLRYMQPQSYGFAPYQVGDEIAVIGHNSLREYDHNPRRKVTAIAPNPTDPSGKEWLITLDGPVPHFQQDDVIDNLSWYPALIARGNHVSMASCRGFLITTREKSLIENNTFHHCKMPGILVENDANGWFESGPIRDLIIRNNRFIACGISIDPKTHSPDLPVHENIQILNNSFEAGGIHAKSVKNLTIKGNQGQPSISTPNCIDVTKD